MQRLFRLLCSFAVAAAATSTFAPAAHAWCASDCSRGQLVSVRVIEDGHPVSLYARHWVWPPERRYFEAVAGGHYAVELRNRTDRRIGVLMSVDGLNVVSGTRSNLGSGESMYVLGPYDHIVIRGWRTSLSEVRQFVFVDEQQSYAERTGQANGDMGWIRVLAFEEQRPLAWGRGLLNYYGGPSSAPVPQRADQPSTREDGEEKAPQASDGRAPREGGADASRKSVARNEAQGKARDEAAARPERESFPGTGWGGRREDHAVRTDFIAASTASDQLILRYEYESGLRALGIIPRHSRLQDREDGAIGFAQPPRW
ncbi:MAG: hypothetical protein HYR73_04730 [Candidatus Eisenbacteria bacterium]|nr:hypothetical protein [Candidatus Eisenbacteria bacterium]